MNSRDRVTSALAYNEPDRLPIDNNGFVSGMHEAAYRNLLKYLNIEDEIRIYDPVQRLAEVKDIENPDGTFADEFGTVYRKVGYYADVYYAPLKEKTLDEIRAFKLPDPGDPSRFKGIRKKAENLCNNTEYSVWAGPVNSLFYFAWCLRGLEVFMADLYAEPKIARYLMDKIVDWNIGFFEGFYSEIGQYIDVFWIGDDWGVQEGPLISPAYFRKEVVPRFKKMISFIKSRTDAKCCYHTCGSVYWCIEDLLEMGVDIVHPVQANAKGNDTDKLKLNYGKRICFHGGTNNQGVFHKDIHTLTIDTLKRIKDLAPGGGYIFSSGHNIQANMPPENVLRLFELGRKYGKYPIDRERIDEKIKEEKEYLKVEN